MLKAFSLLELVLVLFIIAIIASFALPSFHVNKKDTSLLALKADFTVIRTALAYHKNQIFMDKASLTVLDLAKPYVEKEALFYCPENQDKLCTHSLLDMPIYSNAKGWIKTGFNSYRFYVSAKDFVDFVYDNLTLSFDCIESKLCKELL